MDINPTIPCICCYLPWETLMSAKRAINDKLHDIVLTHNLPHYSQQQQHLRNQQKPQWIIESFTLKFCTQSVTGNYYARMSQFFFLDKWISQKYCYQYSTHYYYYYCYRIKEPILKSLWGLRKGFSVITPPNLNGFGWNLEYICGTTMRTCTRNCWMPQGFRQTSPKRVLFFSVTIITQPFGHLPCTDLDIVWNNRRESVRTPMRNVQIFAWGFCKPPKPPRSSILEWVLVTSIQLKWQQISGDRNHFGD